MVWMNLVYTFICRKYLEKKSDRTIKSMEYILVLMQYESLKKWGSPLLRDPIYFDGENIRVVFISDLLRVMPPTVLGTDGFHSGREMDRYIKLLNKYKTNSESELRNMALEFLNSGLIEDKYITIGEYNNIIMRMIARLKANKKKYAWRAIFRVIIGLFAFAFFLGVVPLLIRLIIQNNSKNMSDFLALLIIFTIFGLPWLIWTWRWVQPTQFEIENGYLND